MTPTLRKRKNIVETIKQQKSPRQDFSDDSDESPVKGSGDAEATGVFDVMENVLFVNGELKKQNIPYRCSDPTLADGNCWWRATAALLGMEGEDAHIRLRTMVCENIKNCPEKWREEVKNVCFNGKSRGLREFVIRQKTVGKYTDDRGIITQATAYATQRNILVFSVEGLITLAGKGEADKHEPLAVFLDSKHYQALVPIGE